MVDEAPIPFEDDITKTQLWQRIDITRATLENHRGEIQSSMDALTQAILISVRTELEEDGVKRRKENQDFLASLLEKFEDQKLENMAQVRGAQLTAEMFRSKMEKDFSDSVAALPDLVKKESSDIFANLAIQVRSIEDKVNAFYKEISAQINNSQIEMRQRTGAVDAKLESVLGKLRSVLKDL